MRESFFFVSLIIHTRYVSHDTVCRKEKLSRAMFALCDCFLCLVFAVSRCHIRQAKAAI